jgi:hypothetical protein
VEEEVEEAEAEAVEAAAEVEDQGINHPIAMSRTTMTMRMTITQPMANHTPADQGVATTGLKSPGSTPAHLVLGARIRTTPQDQPEEQPQVLTGVSCLRHPECQEDIVLRPLDPQPVPIVIAHFEPGLGAAFPSRSAVL